MIVSTKKSPNFYKFSQPVPLYKIDLRQHFAIARINL